MWIALLSPIHSSKEAIVTSFSFLSEKKNTIYKNVKLSWCYIKMLSNFTCKYITKQFNNYAHNLYRLSPLIPLAFMILGGKSISRLSHLDGTETDLKVSCKCYFLCLDQNLCVIRHY